MSPVSLSTARSEICFPRVSGDEPVLTLTRDMSV